MKTGEILFFLISARICAKKAFSLNNLTKKVKCAKMGGNFEKMKAKKLKKVPFFAQKPQLFLELV